MVGGSLSVRDPEKSIHLPPEGLIKPKRFGSWYLGEKEPSIGQESS
jgi:hypothetical protein